MASQRLATYGSLGPGRTNHHHLADLRGRWLKGTVRGRLVAEGWGAALGFPGLVLEENGPVVAVDLFESPELAAQWARLDAFEGAGYRRVVTAVETPEGQVEASIYVLARAG
jgi:gamma-glutamylcyclotransferase (GGCT)/AIG2-like uncharacterized protein YtfP